MKLDKILKIAVLSVSFLLAAVYLFSEINTDSDIWLHLGTGRYIQETRTIPCRDIFSSTMNGKRWLNHEWLSQVIAYSFFKAFGINGVIFLRFIVISLALLFLFKMVYKNGDYLIAGVSLLLFVVTSGNRFNDRPEMYTLFFMALYIYLLSAFWARKVVWVIPAAQLLWANMHGYHILGPLIIFVYAAVYFIKKDPARKTLTLVFLASLAVCVLNPNGLKGMLYPFSALIDINTTSKVLTSYINELVPPFKIPATEMPPYLAWYEVLLAVSAAGIVLNLRKTDISLAALFVITLSMSLFSIRNIPVFSIIGCAAFASNAGALLAPFKLKKLRMAASVFLIAVVGVYVFKEATAKYYVFDTNSFKSRLFGMSPIRYPVKAADFLKENNIKGPLLNDFYSGSYLIWRLYPDERVFIDGRTELYGADFYKEYRNALQHNSALERLLDKYDINAVVFFNPQKAPEEMTQWLYKSGDWALVYFDDMSFIFVKNTDANSRITEKYRIYLKDFKIPPFEAGDKLKKGEISPYRYLNWGKLFAIVEAYDKAKEAAGIALSIDKKDALSYILLGVIYIRTGQYDKAVDVFKAGIGYNKKNVKLYYNLGVAYGLTGNSDLSIEYYKKAAKIDPHFPDARFGLALAYKQKGMLGPAKDLFLSLEKDDLTGDAHCQLGYIYMKEKDIDKARKAFDKALKLNQYSAIAYNGLGLVYGKKGLYDMAIMRFKVALQINPKFKEAHDNLGITYLKLKQYEKAIGEWEAILKIDPRAEWARQRIEKTQEYINSRVEAGGGQEQ